VFALQDAALISLRKQKLIPYENATFGVMKLLLLFPLVSLLPDFGIYLSWIIPLAILVPVMSVVIFRRRPGMNATVPAAAHPAPLSRLAWDYVGYLFLIGATFFLPVIALELLPALGAAVFSIAWLTSYTIDLLAINMGTALTVETAYGGDPRALRRTALRHGLLLISGIAILGALAAPLILSLYGPQYRSEGVLTLRLLMLAGIPRCLATFAIAEARAHHQIGFIVRLRAQDLVVALGLALVLTPRLGVSGMAIAWLCAQVLSGAVGLHRLLRWSPNPLDATGATS
jgi:O-antigen/teichoic acid export membrane protein